jgi:hypothetical protein
MVISAAAAALPSPCLGAASPLLHPSTRFLLTVGVCLAGEGLLAQPGLDQGIVVEVQAVGVLQAIQQAIQQQRSSSLT